MEPSLLVVDSDLAFCFWLAKILDGAGFQTFPSRDVPSALMLLRELPELDGNVAMVILGDSQPDAGRLIEHCRQRSPGLQVLWIRNGDRPHTGYDGDAVWTRPPGRPPNDAKELLVCIGRVLASQRPE